MSQHYNYVVSFQIYNFDLTIYNLKFNFHKPKRKSSTSHNNPKKNNT